jgi:hypothetical protein
MLRDSGIYVDQEILKNASPLEQIRRLLTNYIDIDNYVTFNNFLVY